MSIRLVGSQFRVVILPVHISHMTINLSIYLLHTNVWCPSKYSDGVFPRKASVDGALLVGALVRAPYCVLTPFSSLNRLQLRP